MPEQIHVKPLPYKRRKTIFLLLVSVFLLSLPFLYFYATGYRFDFQKPTNLVSTGGMYIAVDKTGAEIYIDGELVRETRTFRKAFYAQNLDVGTHRVHVQKEGNHTWVKELPVSKRLVTEAEAFNLPLVPQVKVIAPFQSATGTMIVRTPLLHASSTNELLATTTTLTKAFVVNDEYRTLIPFFSTTSTTTNSGSIAAQVKTLIGSNSTSTTANEPLPTSTIISRGVKLYESGDDLFATWVGNFEQMPYYYCSPDFPPYSTSTPEEVSGVRPLGMRTLLTPEEAFIRGEETGELVIHPVQSVSRDIACDPTIRIDHRQERIIDFDFLPGSSDFVLVVLEDGIFQVEIDDRSWQNMQPLIMGENLRMHIENGNIYVYDGTLIYHVSTQREE